MPQTVVVVGGSLAGLIHGLQHKRRGNNVTILERESGERYSHHAGIGFGEHVDEFIRKYDLTGLTPAFESHARRFSYYKRPNVLNTGGSIRLTSWGLMYRILRANFDSMSSTACPNPPSSLETDGSAQYLNGKQVTSLQHSNADEPITVQYRDMKSGEQSSISADLLIGADGFGSTIRRLVGASVTRKYAGYVAWRGTLPERLISKETVEFFSDRMSFNFSKGTYLVCYVIPTDNGNFQPGERLLNWVWYYNVSENSPEMVQIFTDIDGRLHENTVPRGSVQPSVWERTRRNLQIAPPFAELLAKTTDPFVTKVRDVACTSASFLGGRVILVGDAFTALRPNIGAATEQAAFHSNTIESVYRGDISYKAWDLQVLHQSKKFSLINSMVAEMGRGTWFSFLRAILSLLFFVLEQRFWRR